MVKGTPRVNLVFIKLVRLVHYYKIGISTMAKNPLLLSMFANIMVLSGVHALLSRRSRLLPGACGHYMLIQASLDGKLSGRQPAHN